MEPGKSDNGWNEWGKHVLSELKRFNDWNNDLAETQTKILVQVSALKVKAGIWGLIGGAIPVAIGLAIWFLKSQAGN